MKVVHVEWIDSEADVGWEIADYRHDWISKCHSVGFLAAETENYIVIANSLDPDHQEFNGRISIPTCSIIEMRTLCQIKTS